MKKILPRVCLTNNLSKKLTDLVEKSIFVRHSLNDMVESCENIVYVRVVLLTIKYYIYDQLCLMFYNSLKSFVYNVYHIISLNKKFVSYTYEILKLNVKYTR